MSNEWEFSCIAQMMQPFPLKYTHRVFPPIKDWRKKKNLYPSFSDSTSWKRLQLFFIYNVSPCPVKAQQWAQGLEMFFQRTIWDWNWKGKKKKKRSPVSPPTVKNFTTCEAPEQRESFCLCSVVVPAERILPSPSLQTLNQHLVGLERSRQSNWLKADSCVNKALSGYWKLGNLHKVCLREGRKGRLGRKEEGWKEV